MGMDRPIKRRDFINGATVRGGAFLAGTKPGEDGPDIGPSNQVADYQAELTGLRGSHSGSFETAHSLRGGAFWKTAPTPVDANWPEAERMNGIGRKKVGRIANTASGATVYADVVIDQAYGAVRELLNA